MAKRLALYIAAILLGIFLIPALVTVIFGRFNEGIDIPPYVPQNRSNEVLHRTNTSNTLFQYEASYKRLELLNELEEYIIMVVAAEMPALWHIEALRAQAVAARTYAVHQLIKYPHLTMWELYQAYTNEEALKTKWGDRFDYFFARIRYSVESTRGEIMLYNGEPILAVFHAMSAGTTELAENVWRQPRPYLHSIFSADYSNVPTFRHETAFTDADKAALLGGQANDRLIITKRSPAGYVLYATFGSLTLSGREVRQRLGLRSTHFTISQNGNHSTITTLGHGHGVGLSQHGANILAQGGLCYIKILQHYYQNITFGFVQ